MGNPLEIDNLQDQVFGERITKNDFEKYEVMDWINAAEDRNNYGQIYYPRFFQISKF
jgi:hypothetical protein